jgi:hypothetical protein
METDKNVTKELEDVRQRLSSWRKTRIKGEHIPEPLWKGAVEIARAQGVSRVASALRLEYYALKRRVCGSAGANGGGKESHPAFVELQMSPLARPVECTVELADRRGAKMTVRLVGGGTAELVALAQTFWRRPS